MRPETLAEFLIATGYLLIVGFCGYLSRAFGASFSKVVVIVGSGSVLVPIFFGLRHYFRSKPYVRDIRRHDWIEAHQHSHRGVYVRIPKHVHGRGRYPRVEFQPGPSVYGSAELQYEVSDSGDVEIFHPQNFFTPPHYKECRVTIRA